MKNTLFILLTILSIGPVSFFFINLLTESLTITYEKKIFDEVLTFVEDCKDPKAVSIILRGSTKHVAEEIERAVEDARIKRTAINL